IAPDKPLLRLGTLTADGNNGGGESQVLMKFGDIFGEGKRQTPFGSRILSAKLTIVAFDPGSTVYLHRLLVPWSSGATWNALASGVSVDNVEASTVRDGFSFGQINMDKQSVEFDVTQTLQKWSDGEKNHGWVFVNTGDNGWDVYSSDWIEAPLRPKLTIEYEAKRAASR
ncbi:MAG: DNRLRE domain-containing protein, partial [Planctomycetota bacterium]